MPLSPRTLSVTHHYHGSHPDSWSAHIPQEDWPVHFGHTRGEAVISLLDWLWDHHRSVFEEVATPAQKAAWEAGEELCEDCLDRPVYLSSYCRQCCRERGLSPSPADEPLPDPTDPADTSDS